MRSEGKREVKIDGLATSSSVSRFSLNLLYDRNVVCFY